MKLGILIVMIATVFYWDTVCQVMYAGSVNFGIILKPIIGTILLAGGFKRLAKWGAK